MKIVDAEAIIKDGNKFSEIGDILGRDIHLKTLIKDDTITFTVPDYAYYTALVNGVTLYYTIED